MIEGDTPDPTKERTGTEDVENVTSSPGKLLQAAREQAGVHVAALAGALKIPVSKLEALESDNFSALPDAVFARALAASVCRVLNLDSAPVLKMMPKNGTDNFSAVGPGINATFKDSARKTGGNSFLDYALRPIGVAVVLLLVGAIALFFIPLGGRSSALTEVDVQVAQPEAANPAIALPIAIADPITSPESLEVSGGGAATSTHAPSSIESNSAVSETQAPVVPAALLEFRALGESWVQVRDGAKKIVFERTLAKGEVGSTTGSLPLSVVVGRADATEVFVRGKPFEISSMARENVARFEVKQ